MRLAGQPIAVCGRLLDERGTSLVETALVLPVVLFLTFGFINLCLILLGIGNANYACRVAVRYASLHSVSSYSPATQAQLTSIVKPFILPYPSNTYTVTENYDSGGGLTSATGPGNNVGLGVVLTIAISYPVTIMGTTFRPISYTVMAGDVIVE